MTRDEAEAVLLRYGWHPENIATLSDTLLDVIALGLADPHKRQPSWDVARHSPSVVPECDEPTDEEIARAMNGHFIPCSALKGAKIAREIKRRELEQAGADVARTFGGDPATLSARRLRALANIAAIGSGR